MAEPILVTGKRISDMELVTVVVGTEKIPTGQAGDLSITPDQIAQHVITKGDFATQEDLSQIEINLQTQINNTNLELTNQTTQTRALITAETQARIFGDAEIRDDLVVIQETLGSVSEGVTGLQNQLGEEIQNRISADEAITLQVSSKADMIDVKRGIADRYDPLLRYDVGERVSLNDGTQAISTEPDNANNPNTDLSGWVKDNSASQIFDVNGSSQQEINDQRIKDVNDITSTFSMSSRNPSEQQAVDALSGRTLLFLPNNKDIAGELSTGNADLVGQGYSTKIVVDDNSYGVELKQSIPNWEKRSVRNLSVHGSFGSRSGKGVTFDPNDTGAGRWNMEYIGFQNLDIGIYKPVGNIGNTYSNISVELANYGYRAKSGVNMHSGSDLIRDSHFRYIDVWSIDLQNDVDGFGQFTVDNTIFEGSTGGGIRIDCGNITPYAPITFRNLWFELIATAATVSRDGVNEVPRQIKLIDTPVAFIEATYFYNIELINSNLIADQCRIDSGATGRIDLIVDANSSLTVTNLITQGAVGKVPLIKSIASANPIWTQNNSLRGEATKGLVLDAKAWGGVVKKADKFTGTVGTTTWSFNQIKGAYTTSCIDDGILQTGAMLLVLDPASEVTLPNTFQTTAGKWYVWGVDVKLLDGDGVMGFGVNSPITKNMFGDIYFEYNKWVSSFGIAQATTTDNVLGFYAGTFGGAGINVAMQNFFIVEFDKESDALAFANSRVGLFKTV